jgi:bacillolysin
MVSLSHQFPSSLRYAIIMKKASLLVSLCLIHSFLLAQKEVKVNGATVESYSNITKLPLMVSIQDSKNISPDKFPQWLKTEFMKSEDLSCELFKTVRDHNGESHERFQQSYKGVKIENSMIIAHYANNRLRSFNGDWFADVSVPNAKALSEQQALSYALNKVNAKIYKWENEAEELHMKAVLNDPLFTYKPKGEFVILPQIDYKARTVSFLYAYKFNIYAEKPLYRANVYVDAQTGAVIREQNLICTVNTPATANTKYSGMQNMTTDSYAGGYRLRETGRGNGVETYNLNNSTTYSNTDFSNASTNWAASYPDRVATDAHWGAEMTYDFYQSSFNRNSIDDNGYKLLSYVHYNVDFANAFWDGQRMTYGDGDVAQGFTEMTGLDVCGHEITHGVVQYTGQLNGGEADALNEGFSDIFGTAVEWFARPGQHNWIMGNEIMTSNLGFRNMSNPNMFQQPDTYLGNYWDANGESHNNNGPCIYWYYLLSVGGNGTNDNSQFYNVSGITMAKASAIAYRTMNVYMTPNTDYTNLRAYAIQAAKDLYGGCSNEVIQTTNAFYAVGVGNQYVPGFIGPAFTANFTTGCTIPSVFNFTNQTNGGSAFVWYFGDGTSSTLANPTHTYSAAGIYTVKLVAAGCIAGTKDSLTKTSYIDVNPDNPCVYSMPASPITYSVCAGTLFDDGGQNGNYSDNTSRQITIVGNPGDLIKITFASFDMEQGYDYLRIYKGYNASGVTVGLYTGSNLPGNGQAINTNTNVITVVQLSDEALNGAGYAMSWSCVSTTGLEDRDGHDAEIVLYPNPASQQVTIDHTQDVNRIEVLNALGQVQKILTPQQEPSVSLSVEDLSDGLYLIRFYSPEGTFTKKLLKQ